MRQFDVICFDYDGTLAHSVPAIAAAMTVVFSEFGTPAPPTDAVRSAVGQGLAATFRQLHPSLAEASEEELAPWMTRYQAVYPEYEAARTQLFPGALETVATLSDAGYDLVVVSNKNQTTVEASAARMGLAPYLTRCVGDHPGFARKPDPRVFHENIAPAFPGLKPARLCMVGDGEPDMAFAAALGAAGVFMTYGYGDRERCLAHNPRLVLDALSELPPALAEGALR